MLRILNFWITRIEEKSRFTNFQQYLQFDWDNHYRYLFIINIGFSDLQYV